MTYKITLDELSLEEYSRVIKNLHKIGLAVADERVTAEYIQERIDPLDVLKNPYYASHGNQ